MCPFVYISYYTLKHYLTINNLYIVCVYTNTLYRLCSYNYFALDSFYQNSYLNSFTDKVCANT